MTCKEFKTCEACGRTDKCVRYRTYANMNLCSKHTAQFSRLGYLLDNNPRSSKDPNEIITHNEYAEIVLYDYSQEETSRALIDIEDVERVKNFKWRLLKNGYVVSSSITGKTIYLHRFITDYPDDLFVDHRDRNKLNNIKNNLRPCTQTENNMNVCARKTNKSGYKGVIYDKHNKCWRAQISIDKVNRTIGRFNNPQDAHLAYMKKAKEIYGDFAYGGSDGCE